MSVEKRYTEERTVELLGRSNKAKHSLDEDDDDLFLCMLIENHNEKEKRKEKSKFH